MSNIPKHFSKPHTSELDDLLLKYRKYSKTGKVLNTMKILSSIKFQRDVFTIAQVRKLFETAMKHNPDTNVRFDIDASIVKSVVFESVLAKLELNKFNDMSFEKRASKDCSREIIEIVDSQTTPNDQDLAKIDIREHKEKMRVKHEFFGTSFLMFSSSRC